MSPETATLELHDAERGLPVIVRSRGETAAAWIERHRDTLAAHMARHGAAVFRGFDMPDAESFERAVSAYAPESPSFREESSPRTRVTGSVYTSTDYNARYPIQFHNEYSYAAEWPRYLAFGCLEAAEEGGETPIANSRRVLAAIDPSIVERFRRVGVRYIRNYTRNGMGVRWPVAFGTQEPGSVESYCRQHGMSFEWRAGDKLRTLQNGAAIIRHPATGEDVWFNHAFFFNVHAIDPKALRDALLATTHADDYTTHTCYGDGEPIDPTTIEAIRSAYQKEATFVPWQRGDLLLIDNMLVAHSRSPYRGRRQIVVTMRERCRRSDL